MDGEPVGPLTGLRAQATDPGGQAGDLVRPLSCRDDRPEAARHAPARIAHAAPGAATPDGDLEPDHGLEPVDAWSIEQADLDLAHGSRQDSKPALP